MEVLGNIIYCGAAVATIGLLFAGGVEIYAYIWKRIGELKNENRSNRTQK